MSTPVETPKPEARSRDILQRTESPLVRPKVNQFVLLLLFALTLFGGIGFVLRLFQSAPLIYLAMLLVAAVLTIPALVFLWYLDRREREPLWLLLTALLWGAVISLGLSVLMTSEMTLTQSIWNQTYLSSAPNPQGGLTVDLLYDLLQRVVPSLGGFLLTGAIAQEVIKGLGLLLLAWLMRSEFNGVRDGIIYGGLIGLGFNLTEAALHATDYFLQFGLPGAISQFITSFTLLGFTRHFLFTALTGAGLGLAVRTGDRWRQVIYALAGLFLAILANATNGVLGLVVVGLADLSLRSLPTNTDMVQVSAGMAWVSNLIKDIVLLSPYMALLLIGIVQSDQWERHILQQELADENSSLITAAEYRQVGQEGALGARSIPGLPKDLSNAIVDAQNKLAFRKYEVKSQGGNPETDAVVQAWRDRITYLRNSLNQ